MMELKQLLNLQRFGHLSGFKMLLFMLYIPVGIVLFLFRSLLSIQFLCVLMILPKSFFLRRLIMWFYFGIMGMFVTQGSAKNKKDKVSLVVSNHISFLDSLAVETVIPSWRLQDHTKLPSWLAWLFGLKNPEIPWMEEVKSLEDNVLNHPFAFFPEEETTNGKVGLLKFNSAVFKMTCGDIQPLVVLAYRPWFIPINMNFVDSSFWSDLFWTMFVPITMFHVSYMPAKSIPSNEDELDDFVKSVEKDIAYVLAKEVTSFTAYDKKEYIKRTKHEERIKQEQIIAAASLDSPRSSPSRQFSRQPDNFNQMVDQVKAVLPQVPLNVIQSDIKSTKNVDATITNLLDGSVEYTPLTDEQQTEEQTEREKERAQLVKQTSKIHLKFSKSYKERHLSFQERKKNMIEEARNKYLDLHPEYS